MPLRPLYVFKMVTTKMVQASASVRDTPHPEQRTTVNDVFDVWSADHESIATAVGAIGGYRRAWHAMVHEFAADKFLVHFRLL
jgi:hypothetical protein